MATLIIAPTRRTDHWEAAFKKFYPNETLYIWPNLPNPEAVECALLWYHPEGSLQNLPNLKLISSMGAGVDHLLRDPYLPKGIPITRIVDELLTFSMTNFIITCVLHFHRKFFKYHKDKSAAIWDSHSFPETPISVGILGLGALGTDAALKIKGLGFPVYGYSRSPKPDAPVPCFSGEQGLDTFLSKVNVLVCLLPLTPQTESFLNKELFSKMQPGSCLINVARGKHLVDDDLLRAMDKGIISEAYLDVFHQEPLPKEHPFWQRENLFISPHMASITNPEAALPQVMDNLRRIKAGQSLMHQVDLDRGY